MPLRLISSLLALAGGLVLLATGVIALLADRADWHKPAALVGYGLTLLAIAGAGYLIVATAPVWLRIIVAVCFPLLAASVWQALTPSIEDTGENGLAVAWLVAGALALLLAGLEGRPRTPVPHGGSHR